MKKLSILAIAFAAVVFAACGGKKSEQAAENADSLKSFEQQQIEASIKMHFDSIAAEIGKLKQLPFLSEGDDGLKLTKEEKQVKPDYLLNPAAADEATTLAEKYRILSALNVDKKIASFKAIDDTNTLYETSQTLYDAMNENGRINFFWQMASAALIEELYVANQNPDKFLSTFTDEAASNVTFRIILILDAINRLAQYDPDIQPVAKALAPLDVLNATTVAELKDQVAKAKDQINDAHKAIIK